METEIVVQSLKAVKPGNSGSTTGCDTQAVEIVPLSVFDEVHDEYMSTIHAFHPPAPTNATLEAGLSRALAEYREWAGRLREDPSTGRRAILLNDAGVRFVEATADVALDTVMPLRPTTPVVQRLLPSSDGAAEELMLVQITRFACGSLVVGQTTHHAVGDGLAICQCLIAWGQATRGVAIDPVPVHDRATFFIPRNPLQMEFEHRGTEFKAPDEDNLTGKDAISDGDDDDEVVVTQKVQFSREFISALRSRASSCAGMVRPYSTMQCLVAHLWRCMTKARGLDGGVATRLHIAVNGRARMSGPPVPEGYTGNVVLWAHPGTTARGLLANPLGQAAELIRQEVARVNNAYFRSFIDFMSSGAVEEERLEPMADAAQCPDAEVYCLQRIPFYDVDFGGGRQFFFMPSYSPVDGVIYILPPSPHGHGSVEAHVSLFSRAMDAFKDCCYSLVEPDILL